MENSTPPPMPPGSPAGPAQTIEEFLTNTAQRDRGHGVFELESPRMLEVNLNGKMNTKMGSMVAYLGNISFKREGMLDQGMGNLLKKAVSGEGMKISYAEGQGKLYLADSGKKIILLKLQNDAIVVNGNDVLAFESSVKHKITMMRKVAGMMAGGLFNVRFDGSGLLAITSHFEPITLRVTPDQPVVTDPNATIAWSGNLEPQLKTDISFKTLLGRGSGDSIQMKFQGDGFVVIQPYEEVYLQAGG
ncbi:AIM24 family protein [Verrucomicrobiaceae bacterium 5K15]|uniref:AIM24 family protein n=1 Tax=Oceaniferula flava TaxID=2800421 RepID=A0AAE2SCP7_9BACT|nr:AIM24 family protein [Oceaniferula flavus]MBK1854095.1 AIM24 family protein [Oceaniferula flavus]MBM1135401.1 AIM24 family protein [Oceaniferula flavus]